MFRSRFGKVFEKNMYIFFIEKMLKRIRFIWINYYILLFSVIYNWFSFIRICFFLVLCLVKDICYNFLCVIIQVIFEVIVIDGGWDSWWKSELCCWCWSSGCWFVWIGFSWMYCIIFICKQNVINCYVIMKIIVMYFFKDNLVIFVRIFLKRDFFI